MRVTAGTTYILLCSVIALTSLWMASITWQQFGGALALNWEALHESASALPLFAWHPLLMTVGMLPALSAAFAVIDGRRRELRKPKRILYSQGHAALMLVSAVSLGLGLYAIYQNKAKMEKPHFQSPHSVVGLGAVAAYAASYVAAWKKMMEPLSLTQLDFNWNCKIHRLLGKTAFLLAGVGVVSGTYTVFGKSAFGEEHLPILAGAILLPQVLLVWELPYVMDNLLRGRKKE